MDDHMDGNDIDGNIPNNNGDDVNEDDTTTSSGGESGSSSRDNDDSAPLVVDAFPSWEEYATTRRRELGMQYIDEVDKKYADDISAENDIDLNILDGILLEFNDDDEILIKVVQLLAKICEDAIEEIIQQFFSLRLRDDADFMLRVCEYKCEPSQFASDRLLDDEEFINKLVSSCGLCLRDSSPRLQNDRKTVLNAITDEPRSLEYASDGIRSDKEFLTSVCDIPYMELCLEYAHENLLDDEDVASAYIRNSFKETVFVDKWQHFSPRLRDDERFVSESIQRIGGRVLTYASSRLQNDYHTVLMAVRKNWRAIHYASSVLQNNIDIFINSQFNRIKLPHTDIVMNHEQTPLSLFPNLFEKAFTDRHTGRCHLYCMCCKEVDTSTIIYYCLRNRLGLIPTSTTTMTQTTRKRKRTNL